MRIDRYSQTASAMSGRWTGEPRQEQRFGLLRRKAVQPCPVAVEQPIRPPFAVNRNTGRTESVDTDDHTTQFRQGRGDGRQPRRRP